MLVNRDNNERYNAPSKKHVYYSCVEKLFGVPNTSRLNNFNINATFYYCVVFK